MGALDDVFAQLANGVEAGWLVTRRMVVRPTVWAGTSAGWFGAAVVFTEPGLLVGGLVAGAAASGLQLREDIVRRQNDFDFHDMLREYEDRVDAIHEQTDADVAAHAVKTKLRHGRQHEDWDAKFRAAQGLPPFDYRQAAAGSVIVPDGFTFVRLPGVVSPNEARAKLQPIRREMTDASGDVHVLHGFVERPSQPVQPDVRQQLADTIRAAQRHAVEQHAQAAADLVVEQLRIAQAKADYKRIIEQRGAGVVPGAGADAALSVRRRRRRLR